MTPKIIAIVTVGDALAGVILTSSRGVRQDMALGGSDEGLLTWARTLN